MPLRAHYERSTRRFPERIGPRRYRGKLVVRVPPEVHRRLALEAVEEDVSLNRLISTKLSS